MKINEKGRSMIEMLGVLAIIGVLSVGGIAGYSKAMAKFRANKTIDQISHIVANVRILFGSQRNYNDLGATPGKSLMIYNAHLFPEEMLGGPVPTDDTKMASFNNPYAGAVRLYAASRFSGEDCTATEGNVANTACKAFVIEYDNIPVDACVDLASQNWDASSGSGLIAFGIDGTGTGGTVDAVTYDGCGTTNMGDNYNCFNSMPMSVAKAVTLCTSATQNTLSFKFF